MLLHPCQLSCFRDRAQLLCFWYVGIDRSSGGRTMTISACPIYDPSTIQFVRSNNVLRQAFVVKPMIRYREEGMTIRRVIAPVHTK